MPALPTGARLTCKTDPPEDLALRQGTLSPIEQRILSCWLSRKPDNAWDVVLVFDDNTELLCSKRDLCLMSEYFAKMFEGNFRESSEAKVAMRDIEKPLMETLVEAYYTRKVSPPLALATAGALPACWRERAGHSLFKTPPSAPACSLP